MSLPCQLKRRLAVYRGLAVAEIARHGDRRFVGSRRENRLLPLVRRGLDVEFGPTSPPVQIAP